MKSIVTFFLDNLCSGVLSNTSAMLSGLVLIPEVLASVEMAAMISWFRFYFLS